MSEKSKLDVMLTILENPIRRKIIRRLSQQPSYPLEIAKEIGAGQQLVVAHLAMMERAGVVKSRMETSPVGPKRRIYFLTQSAYLTVTFGPHLYDEKYITFETITDKLSKDAIAFLGRIDEIKYKNPHNSLEPLADLISDINKKMASIEDEKAVLLYLRNLAMKQVSEALETEKITQEERRILHFILDEQIKDVDEISQTLNFRESQVRKILEKIKKEHPNLGLC
ncbi:MAG: ArsR family transcriptional regulator [Candidatus Bathyarchaeota archaeon]|nr:ArsR family transcriptional regulator [Candidatus Bathyarchaeota archaeon]